MKSGVQLIAEERKRQIEKEGWTREHDDLHKDGQMAQAAACYVVPILAEISYLWPWEEKWWKPCPDNRIRELQKAGALIAAEIDRLNRIKK